MDLVKALDALRLAEEAEEGGPQRVGGGNVHGPLKRRPLKPLRRA